VLGEQRLSVDEVSLQLGVFNIEDISVELLKLGVGHLRRIQGQVVGKDNLEFLGSDVAAPVSNLASEGVDVFGFLRVRVSVDAEHVGTFLALVLLGVVNILDRSLEVDFGLGAGGVQKAGLRGSSFGDSGHSSGSVVRSTVALQELDSGVGSEANDPLNDLVLGAAGLEKSETNHLLLLT